MGFLIEIALLGIIPLGFYVITLLHPASASAMGEHPKFVLTLIIVGTVLLNLAFGIFVTEPCRATISPHPVTDNLGNFYTTEYKDGGEWCRWVRGTFYSGS